jgi:hypothetical protein
MNPQSPLGILIGSGGAGGGAGSIIGAGGILLFIFILLIFVIQGFIIGAIVGLLFTSSSSLLTAGVRHGIIQTILFASDNSANKYTFKGFVKIFLLDGILVGSILGFVQGLITGQQVLVQYETNSKNKAGKTAYSQTINSAGRNYSQNPNGIYDYSKGQMPVLKVSSTDRMPVINYNIQDKMANMSYLIPNLQMINEMPKHILLDIPDEKEDTPVEQPLLKVEARKLSFAEIRISEVTAVALPIIEVQRALVEPVITKNKVQRYRVEPTPNLQNRLKSFENESNKLHPDFYQEKQIIPSGKFLEYPNSSAATITRPMHLWPISVGNISIKNFENKAETDMIQTIQENEEIEIIFDASGENENIGQEPFDTSYNKENGFEATPMETAGIIE